MHNQHLLLTPSLLALIEVLLLATAAGGILFCSRRLSRGYQATSFLVIERAFAPLARRERLAVLLVGVSVVAVRVLLLPILDVPHPDSHDKFSYLLVADTFEHGGLDPVWFAPNPSVTHDYELLTGKLRQLTRGAARLKMPDGHAGSIGAWRLASANHISSHFHAESVWNRADIDRSKVGRARDMGNHGNFERLNYFKDRSVWTINPDTSPPQAKPLMPVPNLGVSA
jgi:hypothetical protein